ncbi:MAG: type IV toxin-antitoxin system AbiEi family antitoxin domain-containing protein [Bacteriovorax sp.]
MNKKVTKLYRIAETQHGYFTAKQAAAAGFLATNYTYHVKAGTWLHEGIGIYRLKNFPNSRESQMAFFALWSRNREDQVQGVYSHETALSIFEFSDVNPSKLQMTVPTTFRKSSEIPKVIKLFYADLEDSEIQEHNGLRLTKPMRSIIDAFKAGTSPEFIEQAVLQAYSRGLITLSDIKSPTTPKEMSEQFQKWISLAEKSQRKRARLRLSDKLF